MRELKIIVPENFREFGDSVNKHIQEIRNTSDSFLVDTSLVRFNNGEGKAVINESIRDKDLYIMSDVSNYDITYKSYGRIHYMSPDEHFQDIKRILSAECRHAAKRTVIMPYLYQSRQDKRSGRESLDCAMALDDLKKMEVNEIITCDVHNLAITNAVHDSSFESIFLGDMLLLDLVRNEDIIDFDRFICISPDIGATARTKLLSGLLGNVPIGMFYKQRDYTRVVDGKNPIIAHDFLSSTDINGKYAIVVDDMIASGGSILDTALSLKKLGAEKVFLVVAFALFTEGIEKFQEYYQNDIFDKVYASNVSYVPNYIKSMPWFKSVDCSYKMATIINELNNGRSIGDLITEKTEAAVKIKKLRREYETK